MDERPLMSKRIGNKELQLKKIVMMMRGVYLIQSIMVIVVAVTSGIRYFINGEIATTQTVLTLLVVMAVMVLFNGYFVFKDTNVFKRLNNQIEIKDEAYKNIEALNLELRVQRHGFLNHIQILYSLMEMEAYEDTTAYLNKLYGDVGKLSANIKTSSVAMNAMLQAKANEAENKGITYTTNIKSRLESMNMPDWELCQVVGNMIDNGFRASVSQGVTPFVDIHIKENIRDYMLVISNSSKPIDPETIEHFFTLGVTTKKDSANHGMGLFISREIMGKYGNSIDMVYEDGQVIVTVTIHKKTETLTVKTIE